MPTSEPLSPSGVRIEGAPGAEAAGREELARARLSFLNREPVAAGVVREPILASWTRSRHMDVRPDNLDLSVATGPDGETVLTRAAEPVLRAIADLFATEPVSVILCDADGVVLSRRTGDRALEQHLDRVWLAPGFSYAERFVGTNGIGTALEARGPAQVFGHEHYVDRLEDLACAGVPIRNPATGKVLGVIDLTCWRRDAGSLLVATAATLTGRIEQSLVQFAQRELAVFNDYLAACRRNRGPVLAIGDNLLMVNDQAREQLEPADQALLVAEAGDAMTSGRRHTLLLDLPSGRTARMQCRPTIRGNGVVGGVLDVRIVPAVSTAHPAAIPVPRRPAGQGPGVAWSKCSAAVDRHLSTGEWLVLEGERGSGKTTVARLAHQSRNPAARFRVLRAEDHELDRIAEIAEELATGGGSLVLAHVDRLPVAAIAELVDVLEPYRESTDPDRTWVVATLDTDGDRSPELEELLRCFPSTVTVPPLRHHIEDVPHLVPILLARLGHVGAVSCSSEAMRVLMHNRWPGNVTQLVSALRKVVAKRRSGVIEVEDLPPECRSTTRRMLSPLESLECDAIVEALTDTGGSKVEAARRLSMSRATIYRKIREYGISVPTPVPVPRAPATASADSDTGGAS
jgi:sigma-54 dependent transcriptional regulator, acetoin dehydrogenase operon transcriptional activator AcoR